MQKFVLRNRKGSRAVIADIGATLCELHTPDRHGELADVVLGFETTEAYQDNIPYFGATVGRYAGRLANAAFPLPDKLHTVNRNHGAHHLHGGVSGFSSRRWDAAVDPTINAVTFSLVSQDGDQGFPGTLTVDVRYRLTDADDLELCYRAQTSATTIINLTNHSYFNLDGHAAGDVSAHRLRLDADAYLSTNDQLIPTGILAPVTDTPFDFRVPRALGECLQVAPLDHTFLVSDTALSSPQSVASLASPRSGRRMEVLTTEPGLQIFVPPSLVDLPNTKDAAVYPVAAGVCLETQHFPDAPNQPEFPSTRLEPGEVFESTTIFRFSTLNE